MRSAHASPHTGEWLRDGACGRRDTARFFMPKGDPRRSRRQREERAVAVCASCPVRPECAAYALTAQERCGIWGGLTEKDRALLWKVGWLDLADAHGRYVDVHGLDRRLRLDRRNRAEAADRAA